jgi:glycerate kinase
MKVVVAPDKFKGSLGAPEVARAIAAGLRWADASIVVDECSMADGGEGTVAALVAATGGRIVTQRVTGPLTEIKVDAAFGILGDKQTAVIEMAAASGLALLKPEDRNPLNTTTYGTGELLVAATKLGVRRIILGIGGSATVDGGIGCAQACGLPVILEGGEPVSASEPLCGRDLDSVIMVKHGRGSPVERVRITVASDVTNPLYGPNGAAAVFGPQKGATPQQVRWLDEALRGLAMRTGKLDVAEQAGAGAAGGLGFGMRAFFGATLKSGAQIMIEATRLRERLAGADLCVTGEGCLDKQSLSGKAPIAVARLCRELGIPCVGIAGVASAEVEAARDHGLAEWVTLSPPATVEESMKRAAELIEMRAAELLRNWKQA